VKSYVSLVSSAVLALGLAACGGGGSEGAAVASSNTAVPASASTTAAVADKSFAFSSGIPALGTTGTSTTLSFTSDSKFAVTSGGSSASGVTTYGSCIFTVTSSTFTAPHPLALGGTPVRIDPCQIQLQTSGVTAGATTNTNATLTLGTLVSTPVLVPVVISNSGQVSIGNTVLGTVTVSTATGGSSR